MGVIVLTGKSCSGKDGVRSGIKWWIIPIKNSTKSTNISNKEKSFQIGNKSAKCATNINLISYPKITISI